MYIVSDQDAQFGESVAAAVQAAGGLKIARSVGAGDKATARHIWNGVADLFQLLIPEPLGGLGLGLDSAVLPLMALGADLVPGPFAETLQALTWALDSPAEPVRAHWSGQFQDGAPVITMPFAVPHTPGSLAPQQDGGTVRVSGVFEYVPYADDASYLALGPDLLADGDAPEGLQALMVPLGSPGVRIEMRPTMDASRPVGVVFLDQVQVAEPNLLLRGSGAAGTALGSWPDVALTATAAMQLGALARLVESSAEHGRNRIQFGQPIGRYQGVKHRIANMKLSLEGARALVYQAADDLSTGHGDSPVIPAASAYVTDALAEAAAANIQIHGAMGYTAEFDAHLYLKRAHAWRLVGGGPDRNRELSLARQGWLAAGIGNPA